MYCVARENAIATKRKGIAKPTEKTLRRNTPTMKVIESGSVQF